MRQYDGSLGWGVLPPRPAIQEPVSEESGASASPSPQDGASGPDTVDGGIMVQRTFFPLQGLVAPEIPALESPLRGRPSRKNRVPAPVRALQDKQLYLSFDPDKPGTPAYPEHPGFTAFSERPLEASSTDVLLPDGSKVTAPESVSDLCARFGIPYTANELVLSIPFQLKAITRVLSHQEHDALQGPTGCGKTFIQQMIAAHVLSQEGKEVLLLAPTDVLVHQHAQAATRIEGISPLEVRLITGEQAPKARQAVYSPGGRFFVATPEALRNDILRKVVDPSRFAIAIFDEAHLAEGDHAYTQVSDLLPSSVRRVLFSATLGRSEDAVERLMLRLKIPHIYEIEAPEHRKFEGRFFLRVSPERDPILYEASKALFNGVVKAAVDFENSLARACDFRQGVATAISIVKEFRRATGLKAMRERPRQDPDGLPDVTQFRLPTFKEMQSFGARVSILAGKARNRFGASASLFYRFQYLAFLYTTLTCDGQFAFLTAVADKLWEARFGGTKKTGQETRKGNTLKNFHRRALSSPYLMRAFAGVSADTPFFWVLQFDSRGYSAVESRVFPEGLPKELMDLRGRAAGGGDPEAEMAVRSAVKKAFFRRARDFMVNREYVDHPKEYRMRLIVQRHCGYASKDQVMVYHSSAVTSQFYVDRLNRQLGLAGIRAVPVVGKKHIKATDRAEAIRLLKAGEAQVLCGNSAANTGLDIGMVQAIILMSSLVDATQRAQTMGRAARKGGFAYIYHLLTVGSVDEAQFYAGCSNSRKARGSIRGYRRKKGEG